MSSKYWLVLLSLGCSMTTSFASEHQELSWNKLVIAGQKAVREGRLNEAEKLYFQSLKLVPARPGEPRYTESLRALADVYLAKGELDKAELMYQKELSVLEAYGKDYPDMLHDLFRLGVINDRKGQFRRSKVFYERALPIAEKGVLSKKDPKPSDILVNLCAVYCALGDLREAENKAAQALKSLPKSNPESAAVVLSHSAVELQKRGQSQMKQIASGQESFNQAAKILANKALSLRQQTAGSESLPVSRSLETLGDLCSAEGKAKEAEKYYQDSAAIRKKFGDNLGFAECQLKLANICLSLGRYEECMNLCRQIAGNHQYVARYQRMTPVFAKLSEAYVVQHKYKEAEWLIKQILTIDESKYGKYSSLLLGTLYAAATNYRNQGKWQECKASCNRAWEIYQKARIPGDRRLGHMLAMLADVYKLENNYPAAEIVRRRIVAVFEKHPGKRQVDLADALYSLAYICSQRGKYKEAESLYLRALSIYDKIPDYDRLELVKLMFRMAMNYRLQGKFVKAEPLYDRILVIYKQVLGLEHTGMAGALCAAADNLRAEHKYTQADLLYRQALAIYERAYGKKHAIVAEVLRHLADNCMHDGKVSAAKEPSVRAKNKLPDASHYGQK